MILQGTKETVALYNRGNSAKPCSSNTAMDKSNAGIMAIQNRFFWEGLLVEGIPLTRSGRGGTSI
jgi:hypothetical protein